MCIGFAMQTNSLNTVLGQTNHQSYKEKDPSLHLKIVVKLSLLKGISYL